MRTHTARIVLTLASLLALLCAAPRAVDGGHSRDTHASIDP
jgi:hypothetical protein